MVTDALLGSVGAMFVARDAAIYAAKETQAITWREGPEVLILPEKMKSDQIASLIVQLPKIFRDNKYPLASAFMTSWLYGDQVQRSQLGAYRRFNVKELSASKAIAKGVAGALSATVSIVQKAAEQSFSDPRWLKLRQHISDISKTNKGVQTKLDFTSDPFDRNVDAPQWVIGHETIGQVDYLVEREVPSDAYGSLARCNVNQYFRFRAYRRDDMIWLKPLACGVRIEDSFDFNDAYNVDALIGLLIASKPSQFLGFFRSGPSGDAVSLTNSDFDRFRREYRGLKVKRPGGAERELKCNDFKVYSDFVQTTVNINEAPLESRTNLSTGGLRDEVRNKKRR